MSKSVPRTSMVFNPDEMVLIGDSESDHMISVLNPKLTASKRAVLTAKASAIKAEPTKQRFAEVWWRVMLEKSLNMQPNPPLLLVAFQAASTKHWSVFIKPHGCGTLFPLLSVWVVVFLAELPAKLLLLWVPVLPPPVRSSLDFRRWVYSLPPTETITPKDTRQLHLCPWVGD